MIPAHFCFFRTFPHQKDCIAEKSGCCGRNAETQGYNSHNISAYFAISLYFHIKEIIVAQKC